MEGRLARMSDRRGCGERQPTVKTQTETEEIDELLELGCHMGPGERYLMLYEGVLTITNRTGLAYWPRGNKRMIAAFDAGDCAAGLTSRQRDEILGRWRRIKNAVSSNEGHKCCCEHGRPAVAEQALEPHPI